MARNKSPVGDRAIALAPELSALPERSRRAWTERMALRRDGDGYAVDSESGETYHVDPADGSCTCPDHEIRGETCKHLRRVAIEINTGRTPPPGRRRGTCVACGVGAFVLEDADAPLCDTCRLDPGDIVRDRESDKRLVVTRVTDRRADEVTVTGTTTTVAAYPTNDGYPDDDIVVEAAYLTDAVAGDDPRTYSFPLSRLRRVEDAALLE